MRFFLYFISNLTFCRYFSSICFCNKEITSYILVGFCLLDTKIAFEEEKEKLRCMAGIILKLNAHNAEESLYLIHVNMTFWIIKGDQNKGLHLVKIYI